MMSHLSCLTRAYQNGYKLGLDISLLDIKETRIYFSSKNRANEMHKHSIDIEDNPMEEIEQKTSETKALYTKKYSRGSKTFEEVESAGIEVSYRCIRCRGCPECKRSKNIECISIQEEIEQGVIGKSVKVDLEKGYSVARLPL